MGEVHPWALLTTADLAALRTAWAHLAAARQRVAATSSSIVQAWRPTIIVTGGAGPTSTPPARGNTTAAEDAYLRGLEDQAANAVDQTRWIVLDAVGELPADWDTTQALIGGLRGSHARAALAWITPVNARIRKALQLDDDQTPIRGNPECPHCTVRLLRTRTASGLIQCTAGCRCIGDPCTCRMPVRERGAPHLWQTPPVR